MADRATRRHVAFGLAAALGAACSPARAQLSSRPITILVPYSPGTGQDILARIFAEELQKRWGQTIVVDNKPGANGTIGTQLAGRAIPDGHTLLMTSTSFTTNLSLLHTVPYDPIKDFAPIVEVAVGNLALAVHPSVPARSVQEFVAYLKTKPNELTYSSPGTGGPHHLAMELFCQTAGVALRHIPYRGTSGAVTDLLSGQVNAGFVAVHVVLPMVEAGQLRLLGAAGAARSAVLPTLPTLSEQGIANFNVTLWYGLFAPSGTSPDVVATYNATINQVLKDPAVMATLSKQGLSANGGPPERLGQLVQSEVVLWRDVVRKAGLAPQP